MTHFVYQSTKTYGNERGLSCAFRQWRADSHCSLIHGYSLGFRFVFGANELDDRNWVIDFGGLDSLKKKLELAFDHTLAVAEDDPQLFVFQNLPSSMCDLRIFKRVGCEAFSQVAYHFAQETLEEMKQSTRVAVISVEAFEHGANSAIFSPEV